MGKVGVGAGLGRIRGLGCNSLQSSRRVPCGQALAMLPQQLGINIFPFAFNGLPALAACCQSGLWQCQSQMHVWVDRVGRLMLLLGHRTIVSMDRARKPHTCAWAWAESVSDTTCCGGRLVGTQGCNTYTLLLDPLPVAAH